MPLHDYRCSSCGTLLKDQYRSIYEGAQARLPTCQLCLCSGSFRVMEWIPKVGRMDAYEPIEGGEFEVYDGKNNLVTVDSLHKLREIERESEKMYRNGEGQQMVWRKYSQDRNHEYEHSFMKDPTPTITGKNHRGEPILKEALIPGDNVEPDVEMGDGVVGESALAMSGKEEE